MGLLRDKIIVQEHHHRGEPYAKTVTINEHRAPTDDSIRLAKEYEEKAWQAASGRIILDLPEIEAKVVACERSCEYREWWLLFTVNGRNVRVRLPADWGVTQDRMSVAMEVSEAISKEIVSQLFRAKKVIG